MTSEEGIPTAGVGRTEGEMVEQVADQSSSDLKHEDFFEREADGTAIETDASKASADELEG